jgi:glucosylceramidase
MTTRRDFLVAAGSTAAAIVATPAGLARAATPAARVTQAAGVQWICSTAHAPWRSLSGVQQSALKPDLFATDLEIKLDDPQQVIDGFGGAFSEKGWLALQALPPAAREAALDALFTPGKGASFNLGRTPIGANDMAREWYSYDETPGDFALEHFSVAHDQDTLIPFIHAARARRPDMKIWASPWSPPTWMKSNGHYAMAPAWPGQSANGLKPEQLGHEGQDSFIQEDRYFEAYARYFRRYVEEYARAGVPIAMVMPQNEFNSAQPFPSCCWTSAGLARFLPFLGREMGALGVEIFFGTLERGNVALLDEALRDPAVAALVRGVGVQWAGKGALPAIHERHGALKLWQSEQECGVGTNDWHYAHYNWGLMKQYFLNGASAWFYWNLAMPVGGMSGWGWPQNALITVDAAAGSYRLNHDYYLLAHASHFIEPGARRLPTVSFFGYDNLLAFRNPDGRVIVLLQNDMAEPLRVRMKVGASVVSVQLPPDSFNTLSLPIG